MQETVLIKPSVQQQFDTFMRRGRVLFFSAPCGFGKTTLAHALLEGYDVHCTSAGDDDFSFDALNGDWNILLIDDLQFIQEEDDWQALCELIRSRPESHFVLCSRGTLPGCLMAFLYTGLLTVLEADDLLFDREDIRSLYEACGVGLTEGELSGVYKESIGYPLGVMITARYMSGGKPFDADMVTRACREIFLYFEAVIYQRFELSIRRFLLQMSLFEGFDLKLARMVSGDAHAGDMLDWLQRNTTMLHCDNAGQFHFWRQFRAFLLWEAEREYTDEKRAMLLNRGGLYYELHEDYARALECYTKGGDHSKVSELLIRNAQLHPGMGHYSEMEKYYRSLPESEILTSPSLMQGMSMLCALAIDDSGSEYWYHKLQEFAQHRSRQDSAGKEARSRLAWLDISLPQRGVDSLTETIPAVFRLMKNKEVALPPFSVTSALPSIMNGGKDFSAWSKKDDFLYQTLRIPVEAILGKDGIGLADCAIAESKFEKGENISSRMLSLIPLMNEIRQNGTPDIEFAINGLLARSQVMNGQPEDARHTIVTLRERFVEQGQTRFLPNIDAMLCRIDLHVDDLDHADEWYRKKAPRDPMHINVMKRYQYLTQAMVELADERPDAALMTLSPLELFFERSGRYIDQIRLCVLTAIALYRKKNENWRQYLSKGLELAAEYRFVRPISVYGVVVLPLLEELEWESEDDCDKWYRLLLTDVRTQAALYPDFLRPRLAPNEALTPMELQILRLICADKSNAEIAQTMDIKLTTVKTHVSHVLSKLDVRRRSEAKTAAKKLRLVPEDH